MARQKNDGKGRLGGRAKGTPNKTTASLKEWIEGLIQDNRQQFVADLKQLTPIERLKVLERLMQYVIAKPSISIDQTTTSQYKPEMGELRIGFDDE